MLKVRRLNLTVIDGNKTLSKRNAYLAIENHDWVLVRNPSIIYRLFGAFISDDSNIIFRNSSLDYTMILGDKEKKAINEHKSSHTLASAISISADHNRYMRFVLPVDEEHSRIFGVNNKSLEVLSKPLVIRRHLSADNVSRRWLDNYGNLSVTDNQIPYIDFRTNQESNGSAHFSINTDGVIVSKKMEVDGIDAKFCVPKGTTTLSDEYADITHYIKEKLMVNSLLIK